MWSCGFQTGRSVELVFHLPDVKENINCDSHGLSKITIWNYNRGIKVNNCKKFSIVNHSHCLPAHLLWYSVVGMCHDFVRKKYSCHLPSNAQTIEQRKYIPPGCDTFNRLKWNSITGM